MGLAGLSWLRLPVAERDSDGIMGARHRLAGLVAAVAALLAVAEARAAEAVAVLAGGCFWCLEAAFEGAPGVLSVEAGYIGGDLPDPTFEVVSRQTTGHREAIRIVYDPQATSYAALLTRYWRNVDPLDREGQFCDRGPNYRTAIFVANAAEAAVAESSRTAVARLLGRPVATEILPAMRFWPAEDHHQDYARRKPLRYDFYRRACGRDAGLRRIWSRPGLSAGGTPF
jgi:peptide-methionine (S)-S-oxide reductase